MAAIKFNGGARLKGQGATRFKGKRQVKRARLCEREIKTNETKFERAALKNIIFALALCMLAAALGGCASKEPQNLKIIKGDEKARACAQTYKRIIA